MNEIEQKIQLRDITYSPDYCLGNELVKVVNNIHVSSKNYSNEIFRRCQQKNGDIKK